MTGSTEHEIEENTDSGGEQPSTTRREFLRTSAGLLVVAAGAGSFVGPAAARSGRAVLARSGQADQKVIAFSSNFNDIPVIQVVKDLITKHAEARGYKTLFDSGQNGKLSDQVAAVQAWVTEGVPAITVLPTQPEALEPYAKRALAKGLIWTSYGGADMKTSSGWIGFLSSESGKQVADAAVAWINKNDPTAKVLVHTQSTLPVNKPRYQVPIDQIKARTKATIVATQDADTQDQGLTVTKAILTAHPDLSVVIGLNDDGALGRPRRSSSPVKTPRRYSSQGTTAHSRHWKRSNRAGSSRGPRLFRSMESRRPSSIWTSG